MGAPGPGGGEQVQCALPGVGGQLGAQDAAGGGKCLPAGAVPPQRQIGHQGCRGHGGGHPPLVEAGDGVQPGQAGGIQADIGCAVQGHAVLGGPAGRGAGVRVVAAGEFLQPGPPAPRLAGAVPAAPQQEHVVIIAEGQALAAGVHIHPAQLRGALQRQYIGTALVQLEPIGAELVQKREVGGHDNVLRFDGSMFRNGLAGLHLQYPGMLENGQLLRDGRGEFQRVKLGLAVKAHRARHRKGEGKVLCQRGGAAQPVQGGQLPLQQPGVVQGIDVVGLFLKIAGNVLTAGPNAVQRRRIGIQTGPGPLRPKPFEQLVEYQPVLGGELGGGVFGDAAADPSGLRHHAPQPGLCQLMGAQQPRQPAANHQSVGADIPAQGLECRKLGGFFPDGFHSASPLGR